MTTLTPTQTSAVKVSDLSFAYRAQRRRGETGGIIQALDHVSLEILPGEIYGILGPNGSGKTTLFQILATMIPLPASASTPGGGAGGGGGVLEIFGVDVRREPDRVREMLGVVFQSPSLDLRLTARENLWHHGRLYGMSSAELRERIGAVLNHLGLSDRTNQRIDELSGGLRRRVEIAKAVLHGPRLLLLDEPTTGLDPTSRQELGQYLRMLRDQDGVTIALTTHIMDLAELCDRLAVVAGGRILAVDTPRKLKSRVGGDVIWIEPTSTMEAAAVQALCGTIAERFAPWPPHGEPHLADGRIKLQTTDGPKLLAKLGADFVDQFESISLGRPTLEDVVTAMSA
ncbi:MAG: ATP-binding cassette domain-containing protein [Phycisphaeraceae bacterium]|nr:ATP-binding cassette domain-containing protein [Phycisphaeraceae bacterium]